MLESRPAAIDDHPDPPEHVRGIEDATVLVLEGRRWQPGRKGGRRAGRPHERSERGCYDEADHERSARSAGTTPRGALAPEKSAAMASAARRPDSSWPS